MRRRFKKHCGKLFVIQDEPSSIALGAAIGIFLGFTPLFGLKTLLALLMAFLFRANKIAAVIGVALHDVVLPFRPGLYLLEYEIGYWLLQSPHHWPSHLDAQGWHPQAWLKWETFGTVGGPMLLGAVLVGAPTSLLAFYLTKAALVRARERKSRPPAKQNESNA